MKRLTTETPDGNFETMLNFVFSQDGWAHIRHDGNEGSVPFTQWAKSQCILHGCREFSAETPKGIDEEICDCMMMGFPDCPVALAYGFAVQACHLRDRLKMYEDVLFCEDGTELFSLDKVAELLCIAKVVGWPAARSDFREEQVVPQQWKNWLKDRFERGEG